MYSKEIIPSDFLPEPPTEQDQSANEEISSFNLYLKKIKGYRLLTPSEEIDLARKTQEGDFDARQKLINHNLRLVVSIAHRFNFPYLSLEDLIQDGNIGLIKATRAFDWTQGKRFSTIASNNIGWEIKDGIALRYQNISLPRSVFWAIVEAEKLKFQFEQEHGRKPNETEIKEQMGERYQFLQRIKNLPNQFVSLDSYTNDDEDVNYYQWVPDDTSLGENPGETVVDQLTTDSIIKIMREATKQREFQIFTCRRGIDGQPIVGLKQLGERHSISKGRVEQIESKVQEKLFPVLQAAGF